MSAGNLVLDVLCQVPTTAGWRPVFRHVFGTTGTWTAASDVSNTRHHVAITFDNGSVSNDPIFYVDGVADTIGSETAPTGSAANPADTTRFGEGVTGVADLTAALQHFSLAAVIWTTAQVNRARWWGRPNGGQVIYFPFLTDKLIDEGSAAETLTATGTTVVPLVTPVVRPCSALLGMGVGW